MATEGAQRDKRVPGRRHSAYTASGELVRSRRDWAPLGTPTQPGGPLWLGASLETAWLGGGPCQRGGGEHPIPPHDPHGVRKRGQQPCWGLQPQCPGPRGFPFDREQEPGEEGAQGEGRARGGGHGRAPVSRRRRASVPSTVSSFLWSSPARLESTA